MPEQCKFCGENSVIEDTVDGSDRKICIECGSLAVSACDRSSRAVHADQEGAEPELSDNLPVCQSCGEPLPLSHTSLQCDECDQADCEEENDDDDDDNDKNDEDLNNDGVDDEDEDIEGSDDVQKRRNLQTKGPVKTDSIRKRKFKPNVPTEEKKSSLESRPNGNTCSGLDRKKDKKTDIEKLKGDTSSSRQCSSCGGENIQEERIGSEEKLVCADCGVVCVDSNSQLVSEVVFGGGPGPATLPYFSQRKQKPKGLTAGQNTILHLHKRFSLPSEIQRDAEEMYQRAFYSSEFYRTSIFMKEHVAAACVFVCCRVQEIPVSLLHFRSHVQRFGTFLKAKKRLLKCLSLSLPFMSLSQKIGHQLMGRGLSARVLAKTRDVLFLCRRAWLTQGRNREQLINLAAYYAYVSDPACLKHVQLKIFREKFGLSSVSRPMSGEFSCLFVKLAQSIPWVRASTVSKTNVYMYLDDILKYQNSLFHMVFQPVRGDITGGGDIGDKRTRPLSIKEVLVPPILKKPRPPAPPSPIPSAVPDNVDLDSAEIGTDEFGSEIDSYILTEEEQEALREHKLENMMMTKS